MSAISKHVKETTLRTSILKAAEKVNLLLRDKQFEAVYQFCYGNDVFVSLPTGYGKSIIYGILPLVFDDLRRKFFSRVQMACILYYWFYCKISLFWYAVLISPIAII